MCVCRSPLVLVLALVFALVLSFVLTFAVHLMLGLVIVALGLGALTAAVV